MSLPPGRSARRRSAEDGAEAGPLETAAGGKRIADATLLHHDKADAVGEAPVSIESMVALIA
jgi:hypothetical protein